MSDILKSNIFFFISSVSTIIITILLIVILFYLVSLLRNVKKSVVVFRKQAESIAEDVGKVRETVTKGNSLGYLVGFLGSFFEDKKGKKKK